MENTPSEIHDEQINPTTQVTPQIHGKKTIFYVLCGLVVFVTLFLFLYQATQQNDVKENAKNQITPIVSNIPSVITPYPGLLQSNLLSNDVKNPKPIIGLSRNSIEEKECSYYFLKDNNKFPPHPSYKKINCETNEMSGEVSTNFRQTANHILLLDIPNTNKILVFDTQNNFVPSEYPFDKTAYNFEDVNKTLDYWLFTDVNNAMHFSILNSDAKTLHEFDYETQGYQLFDTLIDSVNNGAVFLSRKFSERGSEQVQTRIDFLDFQTYQIKTVLSTEPISVAGRGCSSSSIQSVSKGEILLNADCLTFPTEIMTPDGIAKISLN